MGQEKLAVSYFAEKNCSRQWRFILTALGKELSQVMSTDELRLFMRQVGQRAATQIPLGDCRTLQEIQEAANRLWLDFNWGWVELSEHPSYLQLRHYCAPLYQGIGAEAASWSPAFLEGVYQGWLASLGAGSALQVKQSTELNADTVFIDYRFSL